MNRFKILSVICVGLILTNLLLIWFFVINNPGRHHKERPKKIIIEKLQLTQDQIKDYEKLIQWHASETRKAEDELFDLKNKLYSTLITNDSLFQKDSLLILINKKQLNMEQIHYQHFSDIKKLCKPNQLKAFEELTLEISNLFSRVRPK